MGAWDDAGPEASVALGGSGGAVASSQDDEYRWLGTFVAVGCPDDEKLLKYLEGTPYAFVAQVADE